MVILDSPFLASKKRTHGLDACYHGVDWTLYSCLAALAPRVALPSVAGGWWRRTPDWPSGLLRRPTQKENEWMWWWLRDGFLQRPQLGSWKGFVNSYWSGR